MDNSSVPSHVLARLSPLPSAGPHGDHQSGGPMLPILRSRSTPRSAAAIPYIAGAGAAAPVPSRGAALDALAPAVLPAAAAEPEMRAELAGWVRSTARAERVGRSLGAREIIHVDLAGEVAGSAAAGWIRLHTEGGAMRFASTEFLALRLAGGSARFEGWGALEGWDGRVRAAVVVHRPDMMPGGARRALVRIRLWMEDGAPLYDNRYGHADDDPAGAELEGGEFRLTLGR